MALLDYLKAFRRRWILVVACFLLATTIGYIVSPEEPSEPSGAGFEASHTLVPSTEVTTGVNLFLAANLAIGPDVARLAAEKLPAGVEPAGSGGVSAVVDTEAGALVITVTAQDQTDAGLNVEAFSAATIEFFQETTTQSDDETLVNAQAELETIEARLERLEEQQQDDPTDVIVQAQIDSERTQYSIVYQRIQNLISAEEPPPPLQVLGTPLVNELEPGLIQAPDDRRVRALLVGAVGLLLGLGLAITVDRLDSRLRERDEFEDAFGLPVLAEIPTVGRRARADHALVTALRPDSAAAEAYRSLRSAITLVTQSTPGDSPAGDSSPYAAPKVLVVTGADGSQGKSTTVVNLATAIAETGRTVIVIDCDFRKPEAHEFLDAKPHSRLADLVTGFFSGYLDQMLRSTSVRHVDLVSSIEPVRDHTSAVAKLPALVAEARGRADVVLIDSSPLLITSDAVDVLRYADAALVACRVGRISYTQAIRARRLLQRADVKVLGVVLTGTPRSHRTPYGQPNRRQRLLTKVGSWAAAPGPDQPDPANHAEQPEISPQPDHGAEQPEHDQPHREPERRAPTWEARRQAAEPLATPRRQTGDGSAKRPLHGRPGVRRAAASIVQEREPEPATDNPDAAKDRDAEQAVSEDETVEFSTVDPDSLPDSWRPHRDGIARREGRTNEKPWPSESSSR